MKPPPVDYLTVTGISGVRSWPEANVISHVQPGSITLSWVGHEFKVGFISGADSYKFDSINGVVNIQDSTTAGAVENHATLTVYVNDDEQLGGIIIFLPKVESEPFPIEQGILSATGRFYDGGGYHRTEFIDVRLAETVIYKGRVRNQYFAKVFGYDDEKNPVRVLLGTDENDHTPVPVDFKGVSYIVACSVSEDPSLTVYYKDRRRRR